MAWTPRSPWAMAARVAALGFGRHGPRATLQHFEKTGTHRQAELVHLLLELADKSDPGKWEV
ncbi:MAG: hypothetical protein M3Z96_02790 [Pseudomonadota bacterium]|nr:hypothetical protein [Pseudomonadota bacterium]